MMNFLGEFFTGMVQKVSAHFSKIFFFFPLKYFPLSAIGFCVLHQEKGGKTRLATNKWRKN